MTSRLILPLHLAPLPNFWFTKGDIMKINRRRLLEFSLKGSALWALNIKMPKGFAASPIKSGSRFLVHIRTLGGMDTTLGLDPLTHSMYNTNQSHLFLEYKPDEILRSEELSLGPAASESLKPYLDQISIIRGVHMRQDLQHEPLNEFWVRASLSNAGSAFFFDLAERFRSRVLVTNRLPNISSATQILLGNGSDENPFFQQRVEDLEDSTWNLMIDSNEGEAFSKLANEGMEVSRMRASLISRLESLGANADAAVKDGAAASVFFANNVAGFAVIDVKPRCRSCWRDDGFAYFS